MDIAPPDVETRVAILRREIQLRHPDAAVPDDVIQTLAERVESNVRELKGALNQVITAHELGGATVNTDLANQIVDKLYATNA